jgi:uncharacterized protein (DUF2384 family)
LDSIARIELVRMKMLGLGRVTDRGRAQDLDAESDGNSRGGRCAGRANGSAYGDSESVKAGRGDPSEQATSRKRISRRTIRSPLDEGKRNIMCCASLDVMPVSTQEKVTALSRDFGSQRRLAELLGVDAAQVTRWRRGEGIDEVNAGRVDLLELVMARLLRLYSAETAERWLVGMNPSLGDRRPLDLIRRGQARELLDAIANERAGSFA